MDIETIRDQCEASCWEYAQAMFQNRYYGDLHRELFDYFQYGEARNKIALVPRDHQKSHCIAVYCSWRITVDPSWTFIYCSANDELAKSQLRVIQDILYSPEHRALWPNMLNFGKNVSGELVHKPLGNNVWTQSMIMVDHPERAKKRVRDATVASTSVGSSKTGLHAKEIIFDDLVTDENFSSPVKQQEVIKCYTNLAKIATTGSLMKAVGTRYADNDLYGVLKESTYPVFEDGIITHHEPLWDFFERVVEDSTHRDGTGEFVWPKKWSEINNCFFGFDQQELAIKKAHLTTGKDPRQLELYYAQYYNDPNDTSLDKLSREDFLYFDVKKLVQQGSDWYFGEKKLKLFAAADLAFTEGTALAAVRRDYTAIAVIGIDVDGYIYILGLDRFQTGKIDIYYEKIMDLHRYWGFREITVETNNGGKLVKGYLEDQVRREGGHLVVNGVAHVSHSGKKSERIEQILLPRYQNKTIYHSKSGITAMLEEELVLARPPHDDLKDVLAICIAESKPPMKSGFTSKVINSAKKVTNRFGSNRRGR